MREIVDDAELWRLLEAVVKSGDPAWGECAAALDPLLTMMAKSAPIGRLKDREDSPREIVTRVLSRLHKRNYESVHRLCTIEPRPELRAWLRVIVKRSAIDYMRESPEYERGNAKRADRWISLATLSSRAVAPATDTLAKKRELLLTFMRDAALKAEAEIREHGEDEAQTRLANEWKIDRTHARRLIQRREQYLKVLTSVLEGHSYPDTAERVGITRREVELTVRYIEDFLEARGFAKPPAS